MKVVLELQDQPSNIRRVTVRHDIVIGRGGDCNLRLSAPQVSRRHCFLRIGREGAFVSDLDSSNGTLLNGKKLSSGKRYPLEDGSTLSVGPVRFIARVESAVPVDLQAAGAELKADAPPSTACTTAEAGFDTMGPDPSDSAHDSSLNFSVEQAGRSAEHDEPTADCLTPDIAHAVAQSDAFEIVDLLDDDDNSFEIVDEDVDEVLLVDDDTTLDATQTKSDDQDDDALPTLDDSDYDLESDMQNFLKGLD